MSDNLIDRLHDEADLCRNEGADDIANLLDEAIKALTSRTSIADRVPEGWGLASIERNSDEDGWVAELWGPYESAKGSLVVEGTGATIEDAVESAVRAIDSTP